MVVTSNIFWVSSPLRRVGLYSGAMVSRISQKFNVGLYLIYLQVILLSSRSHKILDLFGTTLRCIARPFFPIFQFPSSNPLTFTIYRLPSSAFTLYSTHKRSQQSLSFIKPKAITMSRHLSSFRSSSGSGVPKTDACVSKISSVFT